MPEASGAVKILMRFWKSLDPAESADPDQCWNWQGTLHNSGCGTISIQGSPMPAHHLSWILHYGEIPERENGRKNSVLHKCNNLKCVNPMHLFLSEYDSVSDKKVE